MEQIDTTFKPLLAPHDAAALQGHEGTIFGLWHDLRLAYLNPAWFRFAADNGAGPRFTERWCIGTSFLDAMPYWLANFYREKYRTCLESGGIWCFQYECSNDRVERFVQQTVHPLGNREGLLVINAVTVERPRVLASHAPALADESRYRHPDGFLHQCAHCRKVRYPGTANRWDWIPAWATRFPENTTHTFCPACFADYFPGAVGSAK